MTSNLTTEQARVLAIGQREEYLASVRQHTDAQTAQARKIQIMPRTSRVVVSERVLAQRVAEIAEARRVREQRRRALEGVDTRALLDLMNTRRRTCQPIV